MCDSVLLSGTVTSHAMDLPRAQLGSNVDNYFRFYKFSYKSFLFLYYISFDIVGLAYVFHTKQL